MLIKFNEANRGTLKCECLLSEDAIDELEQVVSVKKTWLDQSYSQPPAKEDRNTLKSLHNSIAKLSRQLNKLNPVTEDKLEWESRYFKFGEIKERILKDLDFIDSMLGKVQVTKGKAGNKRLDNNLVDLVCAVALVMQKHGVTPKKLGKHFRNTLGIIFRTIGEDEAAIKTIIDNHWSEIRDDLETANDFPNGEPDWEEYYNQLTQKRHS